MDIIRHSDYFNPLTINTTIHIIGVGAVGSNIAANLTRLGVKELHIWDMDTVSSYNIPNQLFVDNNIGKLKIDAVKEEIQRINPNIIVHTHQEYKHEELKGYVFLCVDSIDLRLKFYINHRSIPQIKAVIDTRIALENGQVITTIWKPEYITKAIEMSNFKEEDVPIETSKCGSKLAILPTVLYASNIATTNFILVHKKEEIKQFTYFNAFKSFISKY